MSAAKRQSCLITQNSELRKYLRAPVSASLPVVLSALSPYPFFPSRRIASDFLIESKGSFIHNGSCFFEFWSERIPRNHPGGSLRPSPDDTDITDKMYQVGLFLELPVIDHLIITEKKYYSFKGSGLLAELAKSEKYVLRYKKEEKRLKDIGRKEGLKKGAKLKAVEMARALKQKGVDVKVIADVSKLSISQIQKL